LGVGIRNVDPTQVEFPAVQEFPFDLLAGFQADRGGQGQRDIDVETGVLPPGADGLHF
jgi:hypothetical protein